MKYLLSIIVILLCSCTHESDCRWEKCKNIDSNIISDICNECHLGIKDKIDDNKPTLLYISNNECSECIANFIDFSKLISKNDITTINLLYWIYGCNKIQFDYYIKRNNVVISDDAITINDTLDIFHNHINDYYSNYLFVVTKGGNVYKLVSDVPVYEWNFKDIMDSTPCP